MVALAVTASCSSAGSESISENTTAIGSVATTDGEIFAEVDTEDQEVAAGSADPQSNGEESDESATLPDEPAPTSGEDASPAAEDTAAEDAAAGEASDETDDDTDAAVVASDDGGGEDAGSGGAGAEPDQIDDLNEFADDFASEVDDIALCRSLAAFLSVVQNLAVFATFDGGEVGEPSETAVDVVEMLVYPALVDDVTVIRSDAPDIALQAFGPMLERIEASIGFLADAGLTEDQIEAIAADPDFPGFDFDVETVDPAVRAAGAAMRSGLGPFLDALQNAGSSDVDTDLLDTELDAECPVLGESLGDG